MLIFRHLGHYPGVRNPKLRPFWWVTSYTFVKKKRNWKPWPKTNSKTTTTTTAQKLIARNRGTKLIAFGLFFLPLELCLKLINKIWVAWNMYSIPVHIPTFLQTILACGPQFSDSIQHYPWGSKCSGLELSNFFGHYHLVIFGQNSDIFQH